MAAGLGRQRRLEPPRRRAIDPKTHRRGPRLSGTALIKRGMDPDSDGLRGECPAPKARPARTPGQAMAAYRHGLFKWNGPRNTAYQQLYGHTPQGAPLDNT